MVDEVKGTKKAVYDSDAVKKELTDRKFELEQELALLYQEKFSDDQVQDAADLALSSTMESLKSSFQDAKLDEYRRVIRALEMLEDGTYGICGDCGLEISPRRLKMFPNAARCLACQEIHEEGGVPHHQG